LSELVEHSGGKINLDALPVGDQTLSAKEIIGNESQERMGLVIAPEHLDDLIAIANREKAPIYEVGEITNDQRFEISSPTQKPLSLALNEMFGSSPKTILTDNTVNRQYQEIDYNIKHLENYIKNVCLQKNIIFFFTGSYSNTLGFIVSDATGVQISGSAGYNITGSNVTAGVFQPIPVYKIVATSTGRVLVLFGK
jgi:hypothetical protein